MTRNADHNTGWQRSDVAKSYDEKRFKSWTGRNFDRMEKNTIASLLGKAYSDPRNRSALDLPCGTGRISELLASQGFRLTCADISQEMLNVAKQRLTPVSETVEAFDILDIYAIDKPTASFDLVTCVRLFQHLDSGQRAKALAELARVSRRFVLVNVMYTSLYYGLVRAARKAIGAYAPRHTTNQTELDRELSAAGLRRVAGRFSQPLYGGNLVLLLEKK